MKKRICQVFIIMIFIGLVWSAALRVNQDEPIDLVGRKEALDILFSNLYSEEEDILNPSLYGEANGIMGYLWNTDTESEESLFLEEHMRSEDENFQTYWLGYRLYDSNGDFIRSNIVNEYAVDLRTGEVIPLRIYNEDGTWDYAEEYWTLILAENAAQTCEQTLEYEFCDILDMSEEEFINCYTEEEWIREEKEDGKVCLFNKEKTIYVDFQNHSIVEITLWDYSENFECPWSIFGIQLGDSVEETVQRLEMDDLITIEGHNMCIYPSGLALQRKGITLLQIDCGAEDIAYIRAKINLDVKNVMADFDLSYSQQEYQEESLLIPYPIIHIPSDGTIADKVNDAIFNEILSMSELIMGRDAKVEYEIVNTEGDAFCVLWTITLDGNSFYHAITFDLINGGEKKASVDFRNSEGIANEVDRLWFNEEGDCDRIAETQRENFNDFYVTPLRLVVQYEKGNGEYCQTPMWRDVF